MISLREHVRTSAALLYALALAACAAEELPPYSPAYQGHGDGGERESDAGLDPPSSVVQGMPEQLDAIEQWGADIADPDKICSGWDHGCAIDRDGKPWCWGKPGHASTQPPADLPRLAKIVCGFLHTCALAEDGSIACWGSGADPEMLDDANQGQSVVPEGTYKDVATGVNALHTCAIDADDLLVCWGAGSIRSTVGMQFNFGQSRPPAGSFRGVVAGDAHSCAIDLATDAAVCWGGSGDDGCFPTRSLDCGQTAVAEGEFRALAAGSYHTCGLREDGSLSCWGKGLSHGECAPAAGVPAYDCGQGVAPEELDQPFVRLRAGTLHTCGVTADYAAHCFGWSDFGQIDVPEVPGLGFAQVAPGDLHTCAITTAGALLCWGTADTGETTPPEMWPGL